MKKQAFKILKSMKGSIHACMTTALVLTGMVANGQAGASLHFDGSDDYVDVPHNAALNVVNTYTFEAWVRPSSLSNGAILSKGNGNGMAGNGDYIFEVFPSGEVGLYATDDNGWKFSNTGVVSTGSWTHVAVTNDGTTIKFYINGKLDMTHAATTSNADPGTNSFLLGKQGTTCNCNLFNGELDEVRVWNSVRTQCEINTYKGCEISSASGLVANYHFNEGTAAGTNAGITNLPDFSGNSFNGALTNFSLSGSASNWMAPGGVISGDNTPIESPVVNIIPDGPTSFCGTGNVNLNAAYSALDFPAGSNSHIGLAHSAGQAPTSELTIETWVYVRSTDGGGSQVLMKGNYGYALHIGNDGCSPGNKLNYWTSAACFTALSSTGTIPDNTWTHVAVVVKTAPQNLEFFINGVSAGIHTSGVNINDGGLDSLIIGMQGTGCNCNFFDGKMDEIRIWDVARTQAQIVANMNNSIPATTPNLQVYLRADNLSGNVVTDLSPNATHGHFTGSVTWEVPSTSTVDAVSNYLWNTGATTTDINVAVSDTLTVTITDAFGCIDSASQEVQINPLPVLNITGTSTICNGDTTTLTAGGADTYTWSSGSSTDNISVSPAATTTYMVTGTTTFGCVDSLTQTVNVNSNPTAGTLGLDSILCYGETTSSLVFGNGNGPLSYTFGTFASGTLLLDTAWAQTVISFSTEYTTTGWSANQVLGAPNTFAYGDIATAWTSSSADAQREYLVVSFVPQKASSVIVYETFSPGFIDTVYVHEVGTGNWITIYSGTATPGPATIVVDSYPVNDSIGIIDAVRIAVNAQAVLNWNEIDAIGLTGYSDTVGMHPEGTYDLEITDVNGCSVISTVVVTEQPAIDVTTSTSSFTITANATGASYQWIDCNNSDLPIAGETNSSYTATANGNYAVIVTIGSCSDTSACVNINSVGIYEAQLAYAGIVPNPAATQVTIHANTEFTAIKITDINGKLVLEQQNNGLKTNVNLSTLGNGMYFVQLFNGTAPLTRMQKLVISK